MSITEKFTAASVTMLAWGYNEELLVSQFLDRAVALLDQNAADFEIVFVNDGSTDRTGEIADDYARREPRVRVLHNERNMNIGYSAARGIAAARKDIIFWQTVDWSYDLTNVRIYLELTRYFDVVQGVRPGRRLLRVLHRSDNVSRGVMSLVNFHLIRFLFGVRFSDYQNISFYPATLLKSVPLVSRSSFSNPELLIRTYLVGARYLEVPIGFLRRTRGSAKGAKLGSILRSVSEIARHWLAWGWKCRWALLRGSPSRICTVEDLGVLPPDLRVTVTTLIKDLRNS